MKAQTRWIRRAIHAALTTAVAVSCGPAAPNDSSLASQEQKAQGERIGDFKGYQMIDAALKARLFSPTADANAEFTIVRYLVERYPGSSPLTDLLGEVGGNAGDTTFRNGEPNAVNMMLWFMALNGLANDMARACRSTSRVLPTSRYELTREAHAALRAACSGGLDPAEIEALWLQVAAYDAPRSELDAWAETTAGFGRDLPRQEALTEALTAALLNPYFLLRR